MNFKVKLSPENKTEWDMLVKETQYIRHDI